MRWLPLVALLGSLNALELTDENYEDSIMGKVVLMMYYQPFEGKSKNMRPIWADLTKEFEGHPNLVIGELNCAGAARKVCKDVIGSQPLPKFFFGQWDDIVEYKGNTDLPALISLAKKNSEMECSPSHMDLCDEKEKEFVGSLLLMPMKELDRQIQADASKLAKVDRKFEKIHMEALNMEQKQQGEEKTRKAKLNKEQHLGQMMETLAYRKLTAEDEGL